MRENLLAFGASGIDSSARSARAVELLAVAVELRVAVVVAVAVAIAVVVLAAAAVAAAVAAVAAAAAVAAGLSWNVKESAADSSWSCRKLLVSTVAAKAAVKKTAFSVFNRQSCSSFVRSLPYGTLETEKVEIEVPGIFFCSFLY